MKTFAIPPIPLTKLLIYATSDGIVRDNTSDTSPPILSFGSVSFPIFRKINGQAIARSRKSECSVIATDSARKFRNTVLKSVPKFDTSRKLRTAISLKLAVRNSLEKNTALKPTDITNTSPRFLASFAIRSLVAHAQKSDRFPLTKIL